MSRKDISDLILETVEKISRTKIKHEEALESPNFINTANLDSIALLRLIMEVEKAYDIKVDDTEIDMELFLRYEDLITFIENKCNETAC